MKRMTQRLRSTKEDTNVRRRMQLPYALEYTIPIWPAKVGGGFQAGNGVDFSACVVDHDVDCVGFFNALS